MKCWEYIHIYIHRCIHARYILIICIYDRYEHGQKWVCAQRQRQGQTHHSPYLTLAAVRIPWEARLVALITCVRMRHLACARTCACVFEWVSDTLMWYATPRVSRRLLIHEALYAFWCSIDWCCFYHFVRNSLPLSPPARARAAPLGLRSLSCSRWKASCQFTHKNSVYRLYSMMHRRHFWSHIMHKKHLLLPL